MTTEHTLGQKVAEKWFKSIVSMAADWQTPHGRGESADVLIAYELNQFF